MLSCSPLTEIVSQRDILEEAIDDGGSLEGGSRLLDDGNHFANVERDERCGRENEEGQ